MRKVLYLTVAFAALMLVVTGMKATPAAARSCDPCPAYTTANLNLRAAPSLSAPIYLVIPNGAEVGRATSGDTNGFAQVTYNGVTGWASTAYLRWPDAGMSTATTTANLNLRVGPSLTAPVILVIPVNSTVQLTGQGSGNYAYVIYNGTAGYAASAYLN